MASTAGLELELFSAVSAAIRPSIRPAAAARLVGFNRSARIATQLWLFCPSSASVSAVAVNERTAPIHGATADSSACHARTSATRRSAHAAASPLFAAEPASFAAARPASATASRSSSCNRSSHSPRSSGVHLEQRLESLAGLLTPLLGHQHQSIAQALEHRRPQHGLTGLL